VANSLLHCGISVVSPTQVYVADGSSTEMLRLSISRPLSSRIADLGRRALATRMTFPPDDGSCGAEHSSEPGRTEKLGDGKHRVRTAAIF
jgi:hypothetical protein